MVFVVLAASTTDCDPVSAGSNPVNHPKMYAINDILKCMR
jgi:hypothetical protein